VSVLTRQETPAIAPDHSPIPTTAPASVPATPVLPRLPALPTRADYLKARRLTWAVRWGLVDPMPPLRPSALLEQTRRLLTVWGWSQTVWRMGDEHGLCVAGGLHVLATVGQATSSQVSEAETYLQRAIAPAREHYSHWNETAGRTWPEVSTALTTATRIAWKENR
jgi:hypothetical protein